MLAALGERRVVPDLLVGTSVEALNAAYLGGRGMTADALDGLARLWRRVRRQDVFPVDPLRQMLAVTGRRPSLCSSDRAYRATSTWLADGGDQLPYPERFLSLHGHGPGHDVASHDCPPVVTISIG